MNPTTLNALLGLLDLALTHAVEIRDLMAKPGGVTNDDIASLMAKHDAARAEAQAIVDALPDDPVQPK